MIGGFGLQRCLCGFVLFSDGRAGECGLINALDVLAAADLALLLAGELLRV